MRQNMASDLNKAKGFIEDELNKLDPYEMQELVAGILRGMGYKTRVSPRGADRGIDIFASPDGLGLEEPRIFVEVKHRSSTMGSQDLRAFLGGRKAGDRCLYVSTGGFSKDAKYEAERATVPLTLIDLPALRELLLEHYEKLDPETRQTCLCRGYTGRSWGRSDGPEVTQTTGCSRPPCWGTTA
jgi:restriction system protein